MDYQIWIDTLLVEIMYNDPEGFKRIITEG